MLEEPVLRRLVDEACKALGTMSRDRNDIERCVAERFNVEFPVRDGLNELIRTTLSVDNGGVRYWSLGDTKRQLAFRHLLDGEPLVPYYPALACIENAIRGCERLVEESDEEAWGAATEIALAYNMLPSKGHGVSVQGAWYWYQSWVDRVIELCRAAVDKYM